MPRTRFGALWRFLVAGIVVVGCAAGTTAVAGLLEVKNITEAIQIGKPLKHIHQLTLPKPGAPETLLLIGSDRRIGEGTFGNTDTMILVRINDKSSTINVMSVPRDLLVTLPDGSQSKINAVYSDDGPSGLLKTLKGQVFPGLKVNHIVIVSFLGFSRMIDAIGCVYTMVDHRYYNNTAQTDYSSINIEPGYQKLCGDDAGARGALAFVRFRHTDSDLVRSARQQDFLRWAKDGFSTSDLLTERSHLINVITHNIQTDQSFASTDGFLDLADLIIDANGHTVKSIPFPVTSEPDLGGSLGDVVESDQASEDQAYKDFITPTQVTAPAPSVARHPRRHRAGGHKPHKRGARKHHSPAHPISTAGLVQDTGDGLSQAAQLKKIAMPVYYPRDIVSGEFSGYCFTITGNCYETPNPSSVYENSYPRKYVIDAPDGKKYAAYAMTLVINPALGEYYNVEGTTWRDPPILHAKKARVQTVDGRKLTVYEDGGKVSLVSFSTPKGVYWVSNTLADTISNAQMVAMAASMTAAPKNK
jgi:polyisoprenyl-teichoic acid--peptidoglycan teichoic acid transferase